MLFDAAIHDKNIIKANEQSILFVLSDYILRRFCKITIILYNALT